MPVAQNTFRELKNEIASSGVTLVAVSKTKPASDIEEMFQLGQLDFGENYVQELVEKQAALPPAIRWHFIGHLQRNKVKYIAPFVYLIHGVDSLQLLLEIQKQGAKHNRIINVLLQVHIATEESKFGLDEIELDALLQYVKVQTLPNVRIRGMMGMASFSDDQTLIRMEFAHLHQLFTRVKSAPFPGVEMELLSMGMSADYKIAIEQGSNMIRIGSMLFGSRNYQ